MAEREKPMTWAELEGQHPQWHRLLVLELVCIAGLLVGLIWLRGADIWWFWSENRDGLRDLGLTLVAVIGLPLLIWRERTGHRSANIAAERHEKQTQADRDRRITDSFTKAVELLGSDKLEARLGAIYALERIARESKRDHWPIMETLTAYVRTRQVKAQDASRSNQSHLPDEAASAYVEAAQDSLTQLEVVAVDIQAALTVLARRAVEHEEENQRINLIKANLSQAYLTEAYFSRAYLSEAYLSGAKLRRADLSKADLSGANLRGAHLSEAKLRRAKLRGADLSGADLIRAYLIRAYLSEADLRRADLSGADLREADLSGADLREANLNGANLIGVDLTDAKLCQTTMPDGTVNNRDCSPEPAPPKPK
jgi:uncharacterized protein YjbI with pentapeptide repeats